MVASLTNLVGECGHIKVTKAKKKEMAVALGQSPSAGIWHVKVPIARDATLAYPDYSQGFEIYTDSSKLQLGAVITQNNWPLEFFSW